MSSQPAFEYKPTFSELPKAQSLPVKWSRLELINSHLATAFGTYLSAQLEVSLVGKNIGAASYFSSDYLSSLDASCMAFELEVHPFGDNLWFCMDMSVLAAIADLCFGGKSKLERLTEPRTLSRAEKRVSHHVLSGLLAALRSSWLLAMPIEPTLVNKCSPQNLRGKFTDDRLVLTEIVLLMGATQLDCYIIYPEQTLEPFSSVLAQVSTSY